MGGNGAQASGWVKRQFIAPTQNGSHELAIPVARGDKAMKASMIGVVLAGGLVLSGTVAAQYAPGYGGGYAGDPRYQQGPYQQGSGDPRYQPVPYEVEDDGYDDDGYYGPQGQVVPFQQGADYGNGAQFDWARVVSVDPIVERYSEPVPSQQCWNEPVEYYEPRYAYAPRQDRAGPAFLGALIGGALGNQVGGGSGRTAATIAGAVIGGTVGYRHPGGRYYDAGGRTVRTSQQRCETRTEYRQDERVLGYNVSYEYNGRVYRTQTDHHPGDRIRVAVQVAAAP